MQRRKKFELNYSLSRNFLKKLFPTKVSKRLASFYRWKTVATTNEQKIQLKLSIHKIKKFSYIFVKFGNIFVFSVISIHSNGRFLKLKKYIAVKIEHLKFQKKQIFKNCRNIRYTLIKS